MDKWEYKVFDWDDKITKSEEINLQRTLNEMGIQGWELISTINPDEDNNVLIFKRKKEL